MIDSIKSKLRKLQTSMTSKKDRLDQVSTDWNEGHDYFRQLAESMQDVFFLLEWPGRKPLYITPSFERFWNFKPGEACREPDQWLDAVHPEDRARVEQVLTGNLSPDGMDIEYRLLRPNGLVNWIHDRWFPILNGTGRARRMIRQVTDITERKRSEYHLRRLATVVTDSNDAVTLMDLSGRIEAWNRGAERLYGYSEDEGLGMSAFQMIPDEQQEAFHRLIESIEQGQPVDSCETQRCHRDGGLLDIWLTVAPLPDETGRITALATTERDITEQKAHEQHAMKYQQQLKALTSEMTLAEERLKRQVATQLHDTIGQSLAFSKLKLESLRETVSDKEVCDSLTSTCEILDQALNACRSLTSQLSYPVLAVLGLERGIEKWLEDEIATKHGIQTHFIADAHDKPLDEDLGPVRK